MQKFSKLFALVKSHKVLSVALVVLLSCAILCTAFVFGSQSGVFSIIDSPFANAPVQELSVDNASKSDDAQSESSENTSADTSTQQQSNPDTDLLISEAEDLQVNPLTARVQSPVEKVVEKASAAVAYASSGNESSDENSTEKNSVLADSNSSEITQSTNQFIKPNKSNILPNVVSASNNTYSITVKTSGYIEDFDVSQSITMSSTYDSPESTSYASNTFDIADGGTYVRYSNNSARSRAYNFKSYPFSYVSSLKIYADDDPDNPYTISNYDQFIENNKLSTAASLTFNNTDSKDITIEVTYEKAYSTLTFKPNWLSTGATPSGWINYNGLKGNTIYRYTSNYSLLTTADSVYYIAKGTEAQPETVTIGGAGNASELSVINLKAYKANPDGTLGEELDIVDFIPAEGEYYNSEREKYNVSMTDYDVIVTADLAYRCPYLYFASIGPKTGDATITSEFGHLSTSSSMTTTYFSSRLYSGYDYTVSASSPNARITRAELTYTDLNGEIHTETFTPDETETIAENGLKYINNSFTFKMPYLSLYNSSSNVVNLYYSYDDAYNVETRGDKTSNITQSVKIADSEGINSIYNQTSSTSSVYKYSERTYGSSYYTYDSYVAGRTYNVSNLYTDYDGKRFVFTDVEILKKDAEGNVTDERVDVTKNDDGTFSFVMPACAIRLTPIFTDKLKIFSIQHNATNMGSEVIAPNDGCYFYSGLYASSHIDSVSLSTSSTYKGSNYALSGETATLTAAPNIASAYRVKGVTAYEVYNNSYSYVTKDSTGNILNTPIDNVVADNGDGTYTITHPDCNYILYIEYEPIEENYYELNFSAKMNATVNQYVPKAEIKGYFVDKNGETAVNVGAGNVSNSSTVMNVTKQILGSQEATLNIGCNYGDYYYSCVYTPVTINVTDESGTVIAKVKYCNESTSFEVNDGFFTGDPEITYNYTNKMLFNAAFKFNMPDKDVNITVEYDETYAPLTINQYVLDEEGNATLVNESDGFSTEIIAAPYNSQDAQANCPALFNKFFTLSGTIALPPYRQNFIVSSGTDTCSYLAAYYYSSSYIAAKPSPANGYMISKVNAVSYNRDGDVVTGGYGASSTTASYAATRNGVTDAYFCSNQSNRSAHLVINVYYIKEAKLTVNQTINAFVNQSSSEQLASVKISDYNESRENVYPFVLPDKGTLDTITYGITGRDSHTVDAENNVHTWTSECGVTPGTGIQLDVTAKGSRNIVSFTPYIMDGENKVELDYTLVSGTGYPGTTTVYKINDAVANDQHIYVDIEYGQSQTLKVDVRMLDENNNVVANTTDTTVTVKGTITTADGFSEEKPFKHDGDTEYFDTITTKTSDSVYAFSNTKLDINTEIDDSGYVIANVAAYQMDDNEKEMTSNRLNVSPDSKDADDTELKSAAVDFSHCTISSLPVNKNVIVIVYLAKTSKMTVSVYTANDAGEYSLGNNTGSDNSYVNVSGNNSLIGYNPQTFITMADEGNYNTSSFIITNNPAVRSTNVLQGSTVEAFAQLPGTDYVLSRIVIKYKNGEEEFVDSSAYSGRNSIYTDPDTGLNYLRVRLGSYARILPSRDDYTIDIYITKAKNITTKVITKKYDGSESTGSSAGYVTVKGNCIEDPQVTAPFTVIVPYIEISDNKYDAIYNRSPFESVAKCVQGTELSVNVKPNSGYIISSVTAHIGSATGTEIKLNASEPDSNGLVTYNLVNSDDTAFLMPALNDIYIDVVFEIKSSGTVNLDLTYTDDYVTFNPMVDTDVINTISGSNNVDAYKGLDYFTDEDGNTFKSKSLESGKQNFSFKVLSKTSVTLLGTYIDGKLYVPYIMKLTDESDQNISFYSSNYYDSYSASFSVEAEKEYNLKVVLVPAARISVVQHENNHYGDTPTGVLQTSRMENERVTVTAANDNMAKPMMLSPGTYVSQFTGAPNSYMYLIAKDSEVEFNINLSSAAPGTVQKVAVLDENGNEIEDAVTKSSSDTYKFNSEIVANKAYKIVVDYDCIDVITATNYQYWNGYLVLSSNDINDIDLNDSTTYTQKVQLRSMTQSALQIGKRLSQSYAGITAHAYFIIEKNASNSIVKLNYAYFKDYKDNVVVNITDTVQQQQFTKVIDGITKYYYWYEVMPNSEQSTPIDNSMDFSVQFEQDSSSTPTPDPDPTLDCQLTVNQYERKSTSGYEETTKGHTVVTLKSGNTFRYNGEDVQSFEVPVDMGSGVQSSSATAITKMKETAVFTVTPPENYIVSKVEVSTSYGSVYNLNKNDDNIYSVFLSDGIVNVNVYYSQPLITISTNNTATTQKGTVDIDGSTIITGNQFMNSTLVNSGDSKKVTITPLTYEDSDGMLQTYHVAYILMGNNRNNMLIMDPSTYTLDSDTGVITINLDNISDDVDMHVQFEGESEEQTSLLIVSHHIKIGDEYEDSIYGEVLTTGTLLGTDNPIYLSDGTPCPQFTVSTESSVTSTVIYGTQLDFNVTPPENYSVDKIEGRFASSENAGYAEQLTFTQDGSKYTLDNTMPNSGVVYVDVYYSVEKFKVTYDGNGNTSGEAPTDENEYMKNQAATVLGKNTLEKENYKFLGWSEDKNSTTADYSENDKLTVTKDVTLYAVWEEMPKVKLVYNYIDRFNTPKQYVTFVYLTQEEINNGNKPFTDTLNENAPYITDLFKSCIWDTENAVTVDGVTTINAIQSNYTYRIYFSAGTPADHETVYDSGSSLAGSRYVEKKFNQCFDIVADSESEGVPFKYWVASDVDNDGNIIAGTEKVVCYTEKYNYRVTKNLSIRPVYESSAKDWAVTLGKPIYSREQYTDDNGNGKKDYVYSDYLISIFQPENRMLDEILANGEDVQFGVLLDSDTSITYDGTGEVQYPAIDVDTVKSVIQNNHPESGKTVSTTLNGHKYYMYDRTQQAVTNKNRCDFYIRFANTLKNEQTVFNVYAYVIVDGKIYISNTETLNIYDCGKAEYTAE